MAAIPSAYVTTELDIKDDVERGTIRLGCKGADVICIEIAEHRGSAPSSLDLSRQDARDLITQLVFLL